MSLTNLTVWDYVVNFIDILLVWFVIYKLLTIIRGTKAIQLLKGIFVIVIVKSLSNLFGFNTLGWLMAQVMNWGVLAILVIFQPELRRALEQLGRGKLFARGTVPEENQQERLVEEIQKASTYMAKRRIGALITIEKGTELGDYVETGIPLKSYISSELLINIFIPNTPLHDGAVILQNNQVAAAACYLPLSESPFISKELGTRHRAAIGMSEVTDSLTIVVSEETGGISVTKNGELYRDLNQESFRAMLTSELVVENIKSTSSSIFNWRGKKNG
ncbi:diadenylate cyclase CdaA [Peribacillus frigoritolerans]|uniref:diadenylate cyclase CdaA n=1 Tax=Peribacillus TaxID=2675229 RepID=UPI000D02D3EB|nr:diadenylate cyclase CdaA [Peribacillus frigoritolerans]MBL3645428.1 TIGR00159 family protein [Bacillus sp. RHFB]MEC0343860.1 diadenylate cyclase CdaA [Peribacillus castrilensis]PRS29077.1 TIGR00159 family protein [Bacillus sp. RJGP41]MCK2005270.1 diadenylate cyclase CdaA [Peribacillus frigoritolerans]MDF1998869.1 diadenylate cyclase CdaA [Peribacillus frigoritolerans]